MSLMEIEVTLYNRRSEGLGLVFIFPTENETEGFEVDFVLVSITVLVFINHTVMA